jgi:hypothetical protein
VPDGNHETQPVQVWADIDVGIADMVIYLNTIPGVRTHASCQGTIGEGGPSPYRPQVMTTWPDEATFERLKAEFDVTVLGENWGYLHPRALTS